MIQQSTTAPAFEDGLATAAGCPACGSPARVASNFSVQGKFPLYHCRECGLGALDIRGQHDDRFDEYWGEVNQRIYADPVVVSELADKYTRHYRRVLDLVPNRSFLDVGSGAGTSIATAARLGFNVTGVEPSKNAVALSRRMYDLPVVEGLLSADDSLPRDFGLLALWDVIEHVIDPEALVRACHAHLAPGGVLLLETPDEGKLLRALIRGLAAPGIGALDLRSHIYYRAHRFYFTRAAMTRLLQRCGFTQVTCYSERTMYRKELRKKQMYGGISPSKAAALKLTFALLRVLPFLENKMVVRAIKRPA